MNELERAKILLRATYELLSKQNENPFVLNILCETVEYDGAECDGCCLMDDISYWFCEVDGKGLDE